MPSESQNCPAVLQTAALEEQLSPTEAHVNVVLTIPPGAVKGAEDGKAKVLTPDPLKAFEAIERTEAPQPNVTEVSWAAPLNALLPILVIEAGIVMLVTPEP